MDTLCACEAYLLRVKLNRGGTMSRKEKRSGKKTIEISHYIRSMEDRKRVFRIIRDHRKIKNLLHYMQDVYLGEDCCSKHSSQVTKAMELLAKITLFILQQLKAKLGRSIPQVQIPLAKFNPIKLFDTEL